MSDLGDPPPQPPAPAAAGQPADQPRLAPGQWAEIENDLLPISREIARRFLRQQLAAAPPHRRRWLAQEEEDLLQEAARAVCQAALTCPATDPQQRRDYAAVAAWKALARYTRRRWQRQRWAEVPLPDADPDTPAQDPGPALYSREPDPAVAAEHAEVDPAAALVRALAALRAERPHLYPAARARFVDHHSIAEIAAALGVSQRTVQSRLRGARVWLAHWLGVPLRRRRKATGGQ